MNKGVNQATLSQREISGDQWVFKTRKTQAWGSKWGVWLGRRWWTCELWAAKLKTWAGGRSQEGSFSSSSCLTSSCCFWQRSQDAETSQGANADSQEATTGIGAGPQRRRWPGLRNHQLNDRGCALLPSGIQAPERWGGNSEAFYHVLLWKLGLGYWHKDADLHPFCGNVFTPGCGVCFFIMPCYNDLSSKFLRSHSNWASKAERIMMRKAK